MHTGATAGDSDDLEWFDTCPNTLVNLPVQVFEIVDLDSGSVLAHKHEVSGRLRPVGTNLAAALRRHADYTSK
jgi:hypothetical protein